MLLDLRSLLEVGSADTAITPLQGELKAVGEQALRIAGPLVLTGYAPSLIFGTILEPTLTALTLTGAAPNVFRETFIATPLGVLTLVGQAPIARADSFLAPTPGVLVATGEQASIQAGAGTSMTPTVGALALVGSAAITFRETFISPLVGTLTLAGIAPTVDISGTASRTPATGALDLVAAAPTVVIPADTALIPSVGALVASGTVSGVQTTGPASITPLSGAVALTGAKPGVSAPSGDRGPIPMRRVHRTWKKVNLESPPQPVALEPATGSLAAVGVLVGRRRTDIQRIPVPVAPEPILVASEQRRYDDRQETREQDRVDLPRVDHAETVARIAYAIATQTGALMAIGRAADLTLGTEGEDEARRWFARIVQDEDEALVLEGALL